MDEEFMSNRISVLEAMLTIISQDILEIPEELYFEMLGRAVETVESVNVKEIFEQIKERQH